MLFFRRTAQLVKKAAGYLLPTRAPSLWQGDHLRPDIRAHLLTLAQDFLATVQPEDAQLRDLILTGSLASGDVLPDSDCDLHLVMDFSSAPAPETARDFLHDHAALWNEHHHVTILGHPVELYVQDIREPHYAAATYSVQDDRWLMVAAQPADAVSVEEIAEHATDVRGRIDAIAANVKAGNDAGAVLDATGLCSELRDMRRHGLATEGPFGLANRVFKALRHAGDLARLQQLARRAYDAKLSIVKAHVGGDADRLLTIEDLATRKAEIEKRLVYLDDEDLPALEGRDDAPAVLAKSQLVMQRARLLGELLAIDYRLTPILKARKLHGRREVDGLDVSIENRVGSVRHWTDHDGTEGSTKLRHPYGYVRGTEGADGEHLDAFLGPLAKTGDVERTTVYVVTTHKPPDFTEIDEQKAMIGWSDADAARKAFLHHYSDERFIARIDAVPWGEFKHKALATAESGRKTVRGKVVDLAKCRLVLKAHIKAFTRTVNGKTVEVPEHEDRRNAARPVAPHPRQAAAPAAPAGRLRFNPPGVKHPPGVSAAKPPSALGAQEAPKPMEASAISHKDLAKHIASFRPLLHKALETLQATFPGVPVAGRLKETSSLAEKLQRKGKGLEGVEDICGTRITLDSIQEQMAAVERIKRSLTVRSEDDYLTRPKEGMNYRSYHMILEVDGRPVELQLRTQRQTRWADYAHDTAYKTHGKPPPPELSPYLKGMSDYFGCRDGGGSKQKCGPPPPCPPSVVKAVGRQMAVD